MKNYTLLGGLLAAACLAPLAQAANFCPVLYNKGALSLPWMPGFVHVDKFSEGDGLSIASFLNAARNPNQGPPYLFFAPDLVARIPGLESLNYSTFDPTRQAPVLSGASMVWPNEVEKLPSGMLPFNALIAPQGFISAPKPGRLSLINLDDGKNTEYLVHQSTQSTGSPQDPANSPRAYHKALFIDMDGDGLKDIVTVRSGFKVGATTYPPYGELVWFKNPGAAIKADQPWRETVLWGGAAAQFLGPDISLDMADFEGDGVPEIVATHFFSNASAGGPPSGGKIVLYGAPKGGKWKDVNLASGVLPRVKTISSDQGFPFGVQIADLNRDGRPDILASNHAPDNCTSATSSAIPGRVYALEMPTDRNVFVSPWRTRILLDNIRPNPSLAGTTGSGRLAPGKAQVFWPTKSQQSTSKPQIVVGGDEAGKVWILRAQSSFSTNWTYDTALVFDLNATYGANATQTPMADGPAQGRTRSTIGGIGWRYDAYGYAEIYIPAYEARQVHVLSYRNLGSSKLWRCPQAPQPVCSVN
ncbi:VCBS repeat-containing protein [Massilia sp. W12]|uniref:FG-GAP repeat domain-containing protein n=1 Tax=Massilia sp. W12 TaxID=3126507 RepID=UPI0030D4CA6D